MLDVLMSSHFGNVGIILINCFLGQGVVRVLSEVLSNFWQNLKCLFFFFINLVNVVGRVVYQFSNWLGYHMPCRSLDGA